MDKMFCKICAKFTKYVRESKVTVLSVILEKFVVKKFVCFELNSNEATKLKSNEFIRYRKYFTKVFISAKYDKQSILNLRIPD